MKERLVPGSLWILKTWVNCYANPYSDELVTQAARGRSFKLMGSSSEKPSRRFQVKLLEDGYNCWLDCADVLGQAIERGSWLPELFDEDAITKRLPSVLKWVEIAASMPNKYLWGGTLGPDFDCSGLVQAAFASANIWLPRDAYQQEAFCLKVNCDPTNLSLLRSGDLLFFGSSEKCSHVGLYRAEGFYWHSSGQVYGNNGIACNCLDVRDRNVVACHYRETFRGAGRVNRCHDGTTLA